MEYKFKLAMLWQLGLAISYYQQSVTIEVPFFQLQISTRKYFGKWFKWYNLIKKEPSE